MKCFDAVARAGYAYEAVVSGAFCTAVNEPEFYWVKFDTGQFQEHPSQQQPRSFDPKFAPRYLAKFEYRINRRYSLPDLLPRLATAFGFGDRWQDACWQLPPSSVCHNANARCNGASDFMIDAVFGPAADHESID